MSKVILANNYRRGIPTSPGAAEAINKRLDALGPEYGAVTGRKYVKVFKWGPKDYYGVASRTAVEFIDPVKMTCYDASSWNAPNKYTSRELPA